MKTRLIQVLFLSFLFTITTQKAIAKTDSNKNTLGGTLVCPTIMNPYISTSGTCGLSITIANPTNTDPNCTIQITTNDSPFQTSPTNASGFYPVGSHTFQMFVLYANGTMDTCDIDILVVDQEFTVFDCPADVIGCADSLAIATNIAEFLALGGAVSDDCGIDSTTFAFLMEDEIPDPNFCKRVRRFYQVFDIHGNGEICTHNIIIDDTTPPVITCADTICMQTLGCSADNVVVPIPDATDCNGPVTVTHNGAAFFTGGNATNFFGTFPVGITPITFYATDDCGNVDSCDVVVKILDVNPPNAIPDTLTCSDIGAAVPVLLIITDGAGLMDTCESMVTVLDTIAPVLVCPPSLASECTVPDPYEDIAAFIAAGGMASDNDTCGMVLTFATVSTTVTAPSDLCVHRDTITRIYSVTDASGLVSTCEQIITLFDDTAPVFDFIPNDTTVYCGANIVPPATGTATATDNCSDVVMSFTDVATAGMPACANNSDITRTWTATDDCDNTTTAVQLISIRDTTPPSFDAFVLDPNMIDCSCQIEDTLINILAGIERTAPDTCFASTVPAAIDSIIDFNFLGYNPCVDTTINFIWTATDDCGNAAMDSIAITLLADAVPPTITEVDNGDIDPDDAIDPIYCFDALPVLPALTVLDSCTKNGIIEVIDTVFTGSICDGTRVGTYNVRPIDGCGLEGDIVAFPFSILSNQDTLELVCPDTLFVCTDPNLCEAFINVPLPTVLNSCSGFTLPHDSPFNLATDVDNLNATGTYPLGETTFTWTMVQDSCDYMTTCEMVIVVEDKQVPSLVCSGAVNLCLDGNGNGLLGLDSLFLSITDNCTTDPDHFIRTIRRMDDDFCDPDDTTAGLGPVAFCCDDLKTNPHMVVLEATDENGNVASCMVEVNVCDKLAPSFDVCLIDLTIDCKYLYDVNDLSEFGSYVTGTAGTTEFDDGYGNVYTIGDGVVDDNCDSISIVELPAIDSTECGNGFITRTFEATDCMGNVSTKTQTINVTNNDPFVCEDIVWPDTVVTLQNICLNSSMTISTDDAGYPSWPADNCALIGVSYKDEFSDDPLSGCPKIIRKFKLIDWCQYVSNSGSTLGLCEFEQTIDVINTIPPVITSSMADTIIDTDPETCLADIRIEATAVDSCTDATDLYWSHTFVNIAPGSLTSTGVGNVITGTYPSGVYRLIWHVDDRCGNSTTKSLMVTIRDGKAPQAICLQGLHVSLGQMQGMEPMAEVWASEFDGGSFDNCTATEDLIISFSATDLDSTNMVVTCDDFKSGPLSVDLWITDEAGNQSYCTAFLDVQDNANLCPICRTVKVTGKVLNIKGEAMKNVDVMLEDDLGMTLDVTDLEGDYAFNDLEMYANYHLAPSIDDAYLNGVSTLDLVLIQRHILGLNLLDNAYKVIAADVDNSNSVNTLDLIQIRKLILGINTDFGGAPSWRFIDQQHEFIDAQIPWSYPTAMDMFELDYDAEEMDFVGVKTADVNVSAKLNLMDIDVDNRSADFEVELNMESGVTQLIATKDVSLYGLQMNLKLASNPSEIIPGVINIAKEHYHFDSGQCLISYNNKDLIEIKAGDILFELNSNAMISVSDELIRSELYNEHLETVHIVDTRTIESIPGFEVSQNHPNPFTEFTDVDIQVPEEGVVTMQLSDVTGRLLYQKEILLLEGANSIRIDSKILNGYEGMILASFRFKHTIISKSLLKIK